MSKPIKIGTKVYYTGDVANQSGHFEVTSSNGQNYKLNELGGDGRTFWVHAFQIGDVYRGHCNPRFVTEAARDAYRKSLRRSDDYLGLAE